MVVKILAPAEGHDASFASIASELEIVKGQRLDKPSGWNRLDWLAMFQKTERVVSELIWLAEDCLGGLKSTAWNLDISATACFRDCEKTCCGQRSVVVAAVCRVFIPMGGPAGKSACV